MQCYTVLWIRNKLIGKRNISLSCKWPSLVIHLPVPRSAVARVGWGSCISRMGFHLSYLMGSYLRHQSYHDCPPRLCLSQQAQPPNPSNILEVSPSRLWRGKKTTTNPHRMCDPSESTRQCQRQTTFCVRAAAALWFSGWFRETHGCPSPPAPSLLAPSPAAFRTLQFLKAPLLCSFKIMLVICGLDKFRAPRPRDTRAAQTHAFGF